jgi:hypothetical protein
MSRRLGHSRFDSALGFLLDYLIPRFWRVELCIWALLVGVGLKGPSALGKVLLHQKREPEIFFINKNKPL